MKKSNKSQTLEESSQPHKIIVADLTEVRVMLSEVIKEHIAPPKHSSLANKPILNIKEAAKFLTDECGHKTSVSALYAQISQLEKSIERGCFKRISRVVPHARVGKYLEFKPQELREWAEEQHECSKQKPISPLNK